jgi:hypothetical protein
MDTQEYARRRRALMRMMGQGSIAILPAAPLAIRSRDVEYPYRQDSDLRYLTGYPEPEGVAVLIPGRAQGEFLLFTRERDPAREVWHGRRAGLEGASSIYGADDAFPIGDIDDILPGLIEGCERIYCTMGRYADFDRRIMQWVNEVRERVRAGGHAPHEFIALDYCLHDMRLFKSRAELRAMRKAARISMDAHTRAMRACRPGRIEHELEAEFWHEFRRHGAEPAYGLIVGGGANGLDLRTGSWTDVLAATVGEMRELAPSDRYESQFGAVREVIEAERSRLDGAPAALLHGDPAAPNFLVTDERVGGVDWERAHVGDPARDLYRARDQLIEPTRGSADERLVEALHAGYRERAGGLPAGLEDRRPVYRLVHLLGVSGFFERHVEAREESTAELADWLEAAFDRRLAAIRADPSQ